MDIARAFRQASLAIVLSMAWHYIPATDAIAQSAPTAPVVPRILALNNDLLSTTTSRLTQFINSNTGDNTPIPNIEAFAELILTTSSVEVTSGGRYAVLFSTFADLYTVIQYDSQQRVSAAYFADGHSLGKRISAGKIRDEKDFILRLFRQRPKLQRDLVGLLSEDESGVLGALSELQKDKAVAREAVRGMLLYVQGMQEYENSPCKDVVESFRGGETFALRFPGGKASAALMQPRALVRISGFDNFVLQDGQVGRETAFIEVGPAPNCPIKRIRVLLSY